MSPKRAHTASYLAALALAASAWAGGGTLISSDGMWRAVLDNHGQVAGFYTPAQPNSDRVSEARIYEANPDSQNLSRRVEDTYAVALGPVIDQGGTHAFTRLVKSVGEGQPPSGNCCQENDDPGCQDPACEAAVCNIDDFCCDVVWDQVCVDLAGGAPACQCTPPPPPITLELEHFMVNGAAGGVLVVLRAINEGPTDPLTVKLFYYVDLDIGSPETDEATVVPNPGGGVLAIRQAVFPNSNPMWFGACPSYKTFEIDEWPAVTNRLDNGAAQLLNADLTAPGAADHSAALASGTETLLPGEALQMQIAFGGVGFAGCLGPPCPWDIDGNGQVGITDLLSLLAAWGPNAGHPADFDGNGQVGITDLLALLANWGTC